MAAFRCSTCSIDWPMKPPYRNCIGCGEPTSGMSRVEPLDDDEAQYLANHFRFERYYAARELKQPEQATELPAPGGRSVR